MRAILIDPYSEHVTLTDNSGTLKAMQSAIGCTTVCHVRIAKNDLLWLDDDGLLREGLPVFRLGENPTPLAGKGLVLGITHDGKNAPCEIALKRVREAVRWTDLETIGRLRPSTEDKHPQPFDFVIRIGAPFLRTRTKKDT